MKTAAKVFLIVGMVIQFFLIYPIIVGVIALRKLESATRHDELTTMGVLSIFFCSTLGGIFMLLCKDDDLVVNAYVSKPSSSYQEAKYEDPKTSNQYSGTSSISNIHARLKELKDLRDQNLITEDEYNKLKEKELAKL